MEANSTAVGSTTLPLDVLDRELYETYVPNSNVTPNPSHLKLDYNATETCAGRLKAGILEGSSSGVVGVVVSGLESGDETYALRGLAHDKEIKNKFPDGILYISLGQESHMSDIIHGISCVVEFTGGNELAKTISGLQILQDAIEKAARWFRPHKCLFLIEDICWMNGITLVTLRDLRAMLHDDSLLVYTTREERFMKEGKTIGLEMKELQATPARGMLLTCAGFFSEDELSPSNKETLEGILDKCRGIPLAIRIAGATVMEYTNQRKGTRKQDTWCIYNRKLEKCKQTYRYIDEDAGENVTFFMIIDSCLEALHHGRNNSNNMTFEEMFRGFCVLQKHHKISGQGLQKLWDLDSFFEAKEIAQKFYDVSLVQMTVERETFYVQLHDSVLHIAMKKTSVNEKKKWFRNTVTNYRPGGGSFFRFRRCIVKVKSRATNSSCWYRDDKEIAGYTPWWSVEDDGFIHDNLCRMLEAAQRTEELVWLLQRPQWIVMRLQESGASGVEQDLESGRRCAETCGGDRTDLMIYLNLVRRAARMSCAAVMENPYEAWFHMYGRMLLPAKSSKRARKFISEIKEHVPRPWVEPSVGLLNYAGGAISETIRMEICMKVRCSAHGGSVIRILWTNIHGQDFVTECDRTYGGRRTYKLGTGGVHKKLSGRTHASIPYEKHVWSERCTFGSFSDNQEWLATAHGNGKVAVWNVDAGYEVAEYTDCPGTVTGVCISGNGMAVACSSEHGNIYIWDLSNDGQMGNRMGIKVDGEVENVVMSTDGIQLVCQSRKSSKGSVHVWDRNNGTFISVPPGMQNDSLDCVTISREGKRVASGSLPNIIKIWKLESSEVLAQAVETLSGVRHIALSDDGRMAAFSSLNKTVHIWDTEKAKNMKSFEAGFAEKFDFSPDGEEVLATMLDTTVQVFHTETINECRQSEDFSKHVACVANYSQRMRAVTVSSDNRLELWETESGGIIGTCQNVSEKVYCVALSTNGNLIASGGCGRVQLHNAHTGELVAETLVMSEGMFVFQIATSSNGAVVVFGSEKNVHVWDVSNGAVTNVTEFAQQLSPVAINDHGTRIAYATEDHSVTVWDVDKQEHVGSSLLGHTHDLSGLVLSSDGKRVVSISDDRTARVWDIGGENGTCAGDPFVHDSLLVCMQSNPTCSRFVTYDVKGCGRLWDVMSGECLTTSSDETWSSTIQDVGIDRLQWVFSPYGSSRIVGRVNGRDQVLATADRPLVRIGDVYFSNVQSQELWPYCRVVK